MCATIAQFSNHNNYFFNPRASAPGAALYKLTEKAPVKLRRLTGKSIEGLIQRAFLNKVNFGPLLFWVLFVRSRFIVWVVSEYFGKKWTIFECLKFWESAVHEETGVFHFLNSIPQFFSLSLQVSANAFFIIFYWCYIILIIFITLFTYFTDIIIIFIDTDCIRLIE